jgi:hypothetical protein
VSASAVNVAEIEAEIRALRPQVATLPTLGIHSSVDCARWALADSEADAHS